MKQLIINAGKILGGIGAMTAIIWGGFKFYDNLTDGQADILEQVEYINIEQSMINEDIQELKQQGVEITDTLKDIITHQKKQDQHMNDMERAARFYIRNQEVMTKDLMEETLEEILKKNEPIVYEEPD